MGGNDRLIGNDGADALQGSAGNDVLTESQFLSVPVGDGAVDILDGDSDSDSCRISLADSDVAIQCENIDTD